MNATKKVIGYLAVAACAYVFIAYIATQLDRSTREGSPLRLIPKLKWQLKAVSHSVKFYCESNPDSFFSKDTFVSNLEELNLTGSDVEFNPKITGIKCNEVLKAEGYLIAYTKPYVFKLGYWPFQEKSTLLIRCDIKGAVTENRREAIGDSP